MEKIKYLILGAGPAGLAFACSLKAKGEDSFLVLEKEEEAGGLCRSVMVDGSPLDIGGGHFLDVRRPKADEFLFQFMPEDEWALFERDSRIRLHETMISHPIEANIWQLGIEEQIAYLVSIAQAGCNHNSRMPDQFVDWIIWKLGKRIAEDYMLPYNRKMFADELDILGTYWLEKLPDVSFEDTLRSCLTHRAYGTQPGHARFYYPKKYGYGEVWRRMAKAIAPKILYRTAASELDCKMRRVTDTRGESFMADVIITTIPWAEFREIYGMPEPLKASIRHLKASSIEIRYAAQNIDTPAHWIYEPAPEIPYHRILVRHNFCPDSRGYWMETRLERTKMFPEEEQSYCYVNQYAYPLNTIAKPETMEKLLQYCKEQHIYGLGRWGEHSHYNSDLVVERAMELADRLAEE